MAMVISNNVAAINTQKNLSITQRHMNKSLEKLSSGYRINVGADAPADLVISELLRSQANGLERAVRNTNEANNVLGIAEGALNEMNEILNKMKQLAIHAANSGVTSTDQIRADQAELDSGIYTMDRIANTTRYSDQFLLNGGKGIVFDRTTTTGNSLLDMRFSRIDQVFKTKNTSVNVQYSAYNSTTKSAVMNSQARRAYSEGVGDLRRETITITDQKNKGKGITYNTNNSGFYNQIRAQERVNKSGDDANNFYDFRFDNISTGANTDAEGNIYIETDHTGKNVKVYSDKNKTNLVASGSYVEGTGADTFLYLNSEGTNGLRGFVRTSGSIGANQNVTLKITDGDLDSTTGTVTKDQRFIVTGNGGSIQFDFAEGTDIGAMASAINNVSASTGVGAAVILADGAISYIDNEDAKNSNQYHYFDTAININELTYTSGGAAANIAMTGNIMTTAEGVAALGNLTFTDGGQSLLEGLGLEEDPGNHNITFTLGLTRAAGATDATLTLRATANGTTVDLATYAVTGLVDNGGSIDFTNATVAAPANVSYGLDATAGKLTQANMQTYIRQAGNATGTFADAQTIADQKLTFTQDFNVTVTAATANQGSFIQDDTTDADYTFTMTGVEYLKNTDANNRIYITYTSSKTDSLGNTSYIVNAYRAIKADGTFDDGDKVATALVDEAALAGDRVKMTEMNQSGLTIEFALADDATTVFAAGNEGQMYSTRQGAFDVWDFTNEDGQETIIRGFNTDKDGKIYTEISSIDTNTGKATLTLYRDAARTEAVATGTIELETVAGGPAGLYSIKEGRVSFKAIDGSGMSGSVQIGPGYISADSAVTAGTNGEQVMQVGYGFEIRTEVVSDFTKSGTDNVRSVTLDGISIGTTEDSTRNTDTSGYIYVKTEKVGDAFRLTFYRDAAMKEAVASTMNSNGDITALFEAGTAQIQIKELNNSGLSGTIDFAAVMEAGVTKIRPEVGIRLYSTDYGANQMIKLQNMEGGLWSYYDNTYQEYTEIEEGSTKQMNGQNATLTVNGLEIFSQGLTATISSQVLSADLVFQEGVIAKCFQENGTDKDYGTTIAQLGYNVGRVVSRAGQLENEYNLFINAAMTNADTMHNFTNGMQLQLGEGSGDQERTVISIQSMAVANLGMVEFSDDFDLDSPGLETQILTLQDVMGGGKASLAVDPVKAMAIIEKAIADVSETRARIGAVQSNLLQTNANNLAVTIENITKTESNIRDTDMASESTEFTKNQIMLSAGTTMLAQANVLSQNVLTLLGG